MKKIMNICFWNEQECAGSFHIKIDGVIFEWKIIFKFANDFGKLFFRSFVHPYLQSTMKWGRKTVQNLEVQFNFVDKLQKELKIERAGQINRRKEREQIRHEERKKETKKERKNEREREKVSWHIRTNH